MKKKITVISEFELDIDGPGLPDDISDHVIAAIIKRNTLHGWFCFLKESGHDILSNPQKFLDEYKGLRNLVCGFTDNVKVQSMGL